MDQSSNGLQRLGPLSAERQDASRIRRVISNGLQRLGPLRRRQDASRIQRVISNGSRRLGPLTERQDASRVQHVRTNGAAFGGYSVSSPRPCPSTSPARKSANGPMSRPTLAASSAAM